MKTPNIRVRIDYDQNGDLSHLEQWDTPEKYYGMAPKCSHGVEMVYDAGHLWKGDHETAEEDPRAFGYTYLPCKEEKFFDGYVTERGRKIANPGNGGFCVDKARGLGYHNVVPFEKYMQYWGNPERHTELIMLVDYQCPCCGSYEIGESVGSIDFMDDGDWTCGTFTMDDMKEWARNAKNPRGKDRAYLASEARDLASIGKRKYLETLQKAGLLPKKAKAKRARKPRR